MADREPVTEPQDPRVEAALREYLESKDRGQAVDPGQFLAEHAEIAEELRSLLAADQQLAGLQSSGVPAPSQGEVSTHSMSERGMETVIPQRVQEAERAPDKRGLPPQFGRYKVLKPLGSGAMGTVYLAEDSQLERKVALKTPCFEDDPSGELLERFRREARSAANLRHPNICPVFDVGEIDGRHYISMAYIKGRPLSAYIQPDKPQPERNILILVRKMALALQEAHDHHIIHRDLKPGNVMVDEKGEPIIMDFGLARKVQKDGESRLTQSGMIVGSPAYMSPEQVEAESDKLTAAADQYSLGVMLYELLTGRLPFRGGITAVIGAILTKAPPPVEELRKDVSPRVAALCARMMHKQADQRFPSCKAVADEIAAILRDERATAAPAPPPLQSTARSGGDRSIAAPSPKPKPTAPTASAITAAAVASITQSNVTSLYEAAQKCMRKHDYEQVVQMLDSIPQHKRSDEVNALLTKARGLADEVAFLLAEIDEAARLNDNEALGRKADELLKLKPRHHKALQLKEELSRYGKGRIWKAGGYTPDGRRIGEGSWVPWIGIIVGLVVFGLTTWAVTIYLKAGEAVVRVQINDPGVEVSFQGRTLNVQSANQEIKVEPGDETLKIRYGDAEFETQSFTLNKGDNPAVVIDILEGALAAKFGELDIGQWPVEVPDQSATVGSSLDPTSLSYSALNAGNWQTVLSTPEDYGPYRRDAFQNGVFHLSGVAAPVYVRAPEAADMAFRLRARRVGGGALHLRLRSHNDEERRDGYSFWVWGPREEARVGIAKQTAAGDWTELAKADVLVSEGEEHELLVAAVGNRLQLYVDGKLVVEARDSEFPDAGVASFNAVAGSGEYDLREFAVRVLEGRTSAPGSDWIDLLGQASLTAQTTIGEWTRDGQGSLTGLNPVGRGGAPQILFSDRPTGSYELETGIVFHSSRRAMIHFPVGDGMASLRLRFIDGGAVWLDMDGVDGPDVPPPDATQVSLQAEAEVVSRIRVDVDGDQVRIAASVNGTDLPVYDGPSASLRAAVPQVSIPLLEGLTEQFAVMIGADSTTGATLTRFRYRPIPSQSGPGESWTDLFNGRDLTGWTEVGDGGWSVQNGVLTSKPGNGWIATEQEFSDFELQLEFQLSEGANSGVFLRIPDEGALSGGDFLEVQLIDDSLQSNAPDWQQTGAVYAIQGPNPPPNPAVGEWHQLTVHAEGPQITVSIDGREVNRVNVETAPVLGPPKRDLKRPSGHIGFQHRNQPVEFRNIRIRETSRLAIPETSSMRRVPFPEDASFTNARELAELNQPGVTDAYPWISPDGLTIYWTREQSGVSPVIRQASRTNASAAFGPSRVVMNRGRIASVSPDGLEIVCLADADGDDRLDELCSGRRSSVEADFSAVQPIAALQALRAPKGTAFSSDGRALYLLEFGDGANLPNRVMVSRRAGPMQNWSAAEPVTIEGSLLAEQWLTYPSPDGSGNHLLVSFTEPGSRHLEWGAVADRTADPLVFANSRPLLLDGERFITRGARYCEATGELFFTRPIGEPPYREMQLWTAHARGASTNVASGALPLNEWIDLDPEVGTSSWKWGEPRGNGRSKTWEDGVLELNNSAVAFNNVQARDVSFKAQVQFFPQGNHVALIIRGEHGKGGIHALLDTTDDGRTYVALLNTNVSKVLPRKQGFVEFMVTAVGDQVTVSIDGETVLTHTERNKLRAGHLECSAVDARGRFKEMQVKILDD